MFIPNRMENDHNSQERFSIGQPRNSIIVTCCCMSRVSPGLTVSVLFNDVQHIAESSRFSQRCEPDSRDTVLQAIEHAQHRVSHTMHNHHAPDQSPLSGMCRALRRVSNSLTRAGNPLTYHDGRESLAICRAGPIRTSHRRRP